MSLLLLFKRLRSGLKVPFLATKRRQPRPRDIDTEPTERSWGRWTNPGHVHPIGPGARGVKAAPSGGGQPPKPAPKPAKPPANPQKGGAKPAPAPKPTKPPTETPKGQEPTPAPTPAKSKLSQRKLPKPPKVKPPTMAAEPAPSPPPAPKPIPEAVPSADAGYVGGEDEHGSSGEAQPSSQQAVAASHLRPTEETEEPLNEPVGNEPATRVGVHVPSGNKRPETKPVDVQLPKEEAERQVEESHRKRDKLPPAQTPEAEETQEETRVAEGLAATLQNTFDRWKRQREAGLTDLPFGEAMQLGHTRDLREEVHQMLADQGVPEEQITKDSVDRVLRGVSSHFNEYEPHHEGQLNPKEVRAMVKDQAWPMLKDYLLENVQDTSTLSAEETNKRVNQAVNLIQYGDRPSEVIDRLKRQLASTEPALTAQEEDLVARVADHLNNTLIPDWWIQHMRRRGPGPDVLLNPHDVRLQVRLRMDSLSGFTEEQITPDLLNRLAREVMSRIEPLRQENVFLSPARDEDEEESGATPLDQIDLSQYNLSPEDEEKVREIIPGLTSYAQMIVNSYNEHHGTNRYPGYDQPTSYDHLESEMYRLHQYIGHELRGRGVNRPSVGFGQDDLVNELIDIATDRIKLAPPRGETPYEIDLSGYGLPRVDEKLVRNVLPLVGKYVQKLIDEYDEGHDADPANYPQATSEEYLKDNEDDILAKIEKQLRLRGINQSYELVNDIFNAVTAHFKPDATSKEDLQPVENPAVGESKIQEFSDDAEVAEATRQWMERKPPAPPSNPTDEEAEAWSAEMRRWEQEEPSKHDLTPEGKKFLEKLKGNQKAHDITRKVAAARLTKGQRLELERKNDRLYKWWMGEDHRIGDPVKFKKYKDSLREALEKNAAAAHKVLREHLKNTGADWRADDYSDNGRDYYGTGAKRTKEGISFVSGMVAAVGVPKELLAVKTSATVGRSFYDGDSVNLNVVSKKKSDWVHEFGHHLEENTPGLKELSNQFIRHRKGDEKLVPLKDVFPRAGYGDDEEGFEDDFKKTFGDEAWYVGKTYPQGSTELISMGLEKMYEDPIGFAHMDPEYFAFMVGVMDGSLLKDAQTAETNPGQEPLQGGPGDEVTADDLSDWIGNG